VAIKQEPDDQIGEAFDLHKRLPNDVLLHSNVKNASLDWHFKGTLLSDIN